MENMAKLYEVTMTVKNTHYSTQHGVVLNLAPIKYFIHQTAKILISII